MDVLYGGIEAGGTNFVCAVCSGPDDIRVEARFPTSTPHETLDRAITFFQEQALAAQMAAVGVAPFGPVDLNPESSTLGYVMETVKTGPVQHRLRRLYGAGAETAGGLRHGRYAHTETSEAATSLL